MQPSRTLPAVEPASVETLRLLRKTIDSNYQSDWLVGKLDCDAALFNLGRECQVLFLVGHFPVPHVYSRAALL